MKTYKSHKTVQAAKIVGFERTHQEPELAGMTATPWGAKLTTDDGDVISVDENWLKKHGGQNHDGPDADHDLVGGYLVEYSDGYLSWSPPEAFEGGYRRAASPEVESGYDIGWALAKLDDGYKVRRAGWNGKGMWLSLQVPDEHSKMTLPYVYIEYPAGSPAYPNGSRVPWLASQTDLLSSDWELAD